MYSEVNNFSGIKCDRIYPRPGKLCLILYNLSLCYCDRKLNVVSSFLIWDFPKVVITQMCLTLNIFIAY